MSSMTLTEASHLVEYNPYTKERMSEQAYNRMMTTRRVLYYTATVLSFVGSVILAVFIASSPVLLWGLFNDEPDTKFTFIKMSLGVICVLPTIIAVTVASNFVISKMDTYGALEG